jgi:hypothetical protein
VCCEIPRRASHITHITPCRYHHTHTHTHTHTRIIDRLCLRRIPNRALQSMPRTITALDLPAQVQGQHRMWLVRTTTKGRNHAMKQYLWCSSATATSRVRYAWTACVTALCFSVWTGTGLLYSRMCSNSCSLRIASHHITSHHITSHHITSHLITSHLITSHHITSHHITSHHITSHHITSHHITSHHITSRHITSHHIASRVTRYRFTNHVSG